MLGAIKRFTIAGFLLLVHLCFVIFYFFYFLFKGRPELKDSTDKLCIENRPHCCLHGSAAATAQNGIGGGKIPSRFDKPPPTHLATPSAAGGKQNFWQRAKSVAVSGCNAVRGGVNRCADITRRGVNGLKRGAQRAYSGTKNVIGGACSGVASATKSAVNWLLSWFRRQPAKTPITASAVPWRRPSADTSSAHQSVPPPPPPPPSLSSAAVGGGGGADNKSSWAPPPLPSSWINNCDVDYSPVDSQQKGGGDSFDSTVTKRDIHYENANDYSQPPPPPPPVPHYTLLTKKPTTPTWAASAFTKSSSTPSTPSSALPPPPPPPPPPFSNDGGSTQFKMFNNQRPVALATAARWKSPEPFSRRSANQEQRGSSQQRMYSSYTADSDADQNGYNMTTADQLLMGRSVYTPVPEAEQMRPLINARRSSATPAPSFARSSRRDQHHHQHRAFSQQPRASTVEPRHFERSSANAEHQKYLANAQFSVDDGDLFTGTSTPVQAVRRRWPPPSNATGPEIIKDQWMSGVGGSNAITSSTYDVIPQDPLTDARTLARSWHADNAATSPAVVTKHYVSSSRSAFKESVFDQWILSETDDESSLPRAVRNPQGAERDYHKLSREYDVVMTNPEKSVQLSSMLRAETGKGVEMFSRRREESDKYTVETQKEARSGDFDALPNFSNGEMAAMNGGEREWSSRRSSVRDRSPSADKTPTPFGRGPYDCRSPTPFRPLTSTGGGVVDERRSLLSPAFERHLDQNRLFTPVPSDSRPYTPSSDNYNAMPRDWRSYRQQYR